MFTLNKMTHQQASMILSATAGKQYLCCDGDHEIHRQTISSDKTFRDRLQHEMGDRAGCATLLGVGAQERWLENVEVWLSYADLTDDQDGMP